MKNLTVTLSLENKKSGLEKVWKKSLILSTRKCMNPVLDSITMHWLRKYSRLLSSPELMRSAISLGEEHRTDSSE